MTLAQLDAEHPFDYGVLVADWEHEQEKCSKCGRPRSECSDPEKVWYPQRTICHADMETAGARRIYDDLHAENSRMVYHDGTFEVWSEKPSPAFPFKYDDGVSIWVSTEDLTPDDHFLGEPETTPNDEAVN